MLDKIFVVLIVCFVGLVGCHKTEEKDPKLAGRVIPVPETSALQEGNVEAIVTDKNGNMQQTHYLYDPNQGGVVINNYDEVEGDGASVFFPILGVGFLCWDGYWVDDEGDYWDGHRYVRRDDPHWRDRWDHYWNHDWKDKYNDAHPQDREHNFNHNQGMHRSSRAHSMHKGGGRK